MMKATVDQDIIIRIGIGDTEITAIPKGVGLERLRWDGYQVIDLMTLDTIWVEDVGGVFILHCIEVPAAQAVVMTYPDRKNLINDAGTYRLKTAQELTAAAAQVLADGKNAGLMSGILTDLDKMVILDIIKLLYCFIVATRKPNAQLMAWLDTQVVEMGTTFDWTKERPRMEKLIDKLKARMTDYYA
jgi:hypothetical protein